MTVAEWRLCRPGDVIQLFGFELSITEENYRPFMAEIMHFVNWYVGDRIGNWIMPNFNPSATTRFKTCLPTPILRTAFIGLGKVFGPAGGVLAASEICFRRWRAIGMNVRDHQQLGRETRNSPSGGRCRF